MLWIIGLLTVVLVLDSVILVLLVLVQLPIKDAGIGQAFGGGATDALFGVGSGNALTKMTKYATRIFFALTLLIYVLYHHEARATLLSGCTPSERRADLVIINGAEPESLDPAILTGQPDIRVALSMFEGLARFDPVTGKGVPGIAETWEVSPDRRKYTFHLRS